MTLFKCLALPPRLAASLAIACIALLEKRKSQPHRENSLRCCLMMAFLGSTRIRMSSERDRGCNGARTGSRPINLNGTKDSVLSPGQARSLGLTDSGMKPYSTRSLFVKLFNRFRSRCSFSEDASTASPESSSLVSFFRSGKTALKPID